MKSRHRQHARFNSIVPLAVFVLVAVVVTTVAQADGVGGYGVVPAAGFSVGVGSVGNSWLLPGGIRTSFANGMYRMQMQGAGGTGSEAEHGWASRFNLMLSIGYANNEDGSRTLMPIGSQALVNGYEAEHRHTSPMMLMTIGHRW